MQVEGTFRPVPLSESASVGTFDPKAQADNPYELGWGKGPRVTECLRFWQRFFAHPAPELAPPAIATGPLFERAKTTLQGLATLFPRVLAGSVLIGVHPLVSRVADAPTDEYPFSNLGPARAFDVLVRDTRMLVLMNSQGAIYVDGKVFEVGSTSLL